ncbi:DUF3631 domain-containing protein [Kitasatospora aureofaciens]|nr:DUF3631 domain-containing protein [Kitasatospora aureofaciens]
MPSTPSTGPVSVPVRSPVPVPADPQQCQLVNGAALDSGDGRGPSAADGPDTGTGPGDGPQSVAEHGDRSRTVPVVGGPQARTERTVPPDGDGPADQPAGPSRTAGAQTGTVRIGGPVTGTAVADGPVPSGPPDDGPVVRDGPEAVPVVRADLGAVLLDELRSTLARYVVLPSSHALDAVTLWVAATHGQPAWQHAPRLAVVGPAKRCGKSRLLDIVTETVHDPLITVNASLPAVFRSITEDPPTLLVDEADTLFGTSKAAERNEELRGVLNAGHQRNRPAVRMVGNGPDMRPGKFPTFAMAALAGIGDLPDTIMDRSVVVRMRRRAPGESVQPFRSALDTKPLHDLRDRVADWFRPLLPRAVGMLPVMPVADRAADTWEPLVIVADLAGGHWPATARAACAAMCAHEAGLDEDGDGAKIRILQDIRTVFTTLGDPPALATATLLAQLRALEEAPWAEFGVSGLTARGLQLLLKDFGVSSSNIRFPDSRQAKGFVRNDFLDPWRRYCPEPAPPQVEGGSLA